MTRSFHLLQATIPAATPRSDSAMVFCANFWPTADGCTAEILETKITTKHLYLDLHRGANYVNAKGCSFDTLLEPFGTPLRVLVGGGFKCFSCSPRKLGDDFSNLAFAYCSDGSVETTKQIYTEVSTLCVSYWLLPLMNLKPHGHNRLSHRLVPIKLSSFRTVAVLPGRSTSQKFNIALENGWLEDYIFVFWDDSLCRGYVKLLVGSCFCFFRSYLLESWFSWKTALW